MKKNILGVVGLFAFGLVTGCAQAPSHEVENAQSALTAAQEAQADFYVADLYTAAQDSFVAAQAEIEAQDAASMFSRDYARAEMLLQSAAQNAEAAVVQVPEKKEAFRTQSEALLAEAEAAVAQAHSLLDAYGRKPGSVTPVKLSEDAGSAQAQLEEAKAAQAAGDYAQAFELGKIAFDKANALIQQMNQPTITPQS